MNVLRFSFFFQVAFFALVAAVSAEADPALLAYSGLGYAGLPYASGLAYAGLPIAGLKSAPCVNALNQPVPCASGYSAIAPLAARIWKREADSEADPAYFATALPYAGLGYGYAGLGYAGLPYAAPYATGLIHTSRLGVCLNYKNEQVPC